MWRSQSLEEWERKKSYLIRSLFEDLPILSPILEGQEPASLSIPSSLSKFIDRAESPLPELIIEVEPKKPNLHDDPEELYNELAKEMRRLYKKDFLGIELSRSSFEYSTSESLNRGRIYDKTMSDESDSENALDEKDKSQIDYDVSEHQKDIDLDSSIQTDTSTCMESSESLHVAFETVLVQVDVHSQEYDIQENLAYEKRFAESQQYRHSGVDAIKVSKTANENETIEGGDDDDNDKEEKSDSKEIAEDTNASNIDSNINPPSHASPDIMRQRQPFVSLETPPHRPVSESNSTVSKTINFSMEVDSKDFSEDFLPSDQEIEIAEGSGNETFLLVTSTPKRKRTSRFSTKMGPKRRLVSYSSSSLSASAANVALQTSFSDYETNCFFWNNLFIGMPTVYNACSCNDHVCTK